MNGKLYVIGTAALGAALLMGCGKNSKGPTQVEDTPIEQEQTIDVIVIGNDTIPVVDVVPEEHGQPEMSVGYLPNSDIVTKGTEITVSAIAKSPNGVERVAVYRNGSLFKTCRNLSDNIVKELGCTVKVPMISVSGNDDDHKEISVKAYDAKGLFADVEKQMLVIEKYF